ncbi:MAG: hypothetical protein FWG41_03500 [Methanomassiliicoccaceae archaeon]|nr:hypothetical protein [Methanomassiliicoccaceae archaeon]
MSEENDMEKGLDLNKIARKAGEKHGFVWVTAEFVDLKELKLKWKRSSSWAEFSVSDYFKDAPEDVISVIFEHLFARMVGESSAFPENAIDWLTSSEFTKNKQPTYLRRSKNLSMSSQGEEKNLEQAYERLIEIGLVNRNLLLFLSWTKKPSKKLTGYCSVLMYVIGISSALDNSMVPDFVVDYCLYHEICVLQIGFDPNEEMLDKHIHKLLKKHPQWKDAETWLRCHGFLRMHKIL